MIEPGGKTHKVELPLIGAYQAANALIAAGLVVATGGELVATLSTRSRLEPVRGRLERAALSKAGAPIYVDYAHTPDAIRAAIEALRPHVKDQLHHRFRRRRRPRRGKRPEMGAVAAAMADAVMSPTTIRARRSRPPSAPRSWPPRQARRKSATAARLYRRRSRRPGAGDIVLIAGKGHEQGQIVGERTLPFDDVAVARECAA